MPRTHRPYDDEFRRQAVELYVNSGRPRSQVARELGISDGSLRKWESDLLGRSAGKRGTEGDAMAGADPKKMAEEIRRLNQEVTYLRRQREILKKAASILAEDPQLGMQ